MFPEYQLRAVAVPMMPGFCLTSHCFTDIVLDAIGTGHVEGHGRVARCFVYESVHEWI